MIPITSLYRIFPYFLLRSSKSSVGQHFNGPVRGFCPHQSTLDCGDSSICSIVTVAGLTSLAGPAISAVMPFVMGSLEKIVNVIRKPAINAPLN